MSRELLLFLTFAAAACAQPVVATAQYDNFRTGANSAETALTPRNVNQAHFGNLFTVPVDGDIYA